MGERGAERERSEGGNGGGEERRRNVEEGRSETEMEVCI